MIKWSGYVACMDEKGNASSVFVRKPEEEGRFEG
jgi:hypothetical protein